MGLGCIFPGCRGHDGDQLAEIQHSIHALAKAVGIVETKEDKIMGTVEDGLAEVETAVAAEETAIVAEDASITKLDADETTDLAALTAAINAGETLTPDQQARFDALTAKATADAATVAADQAEVDADDAALNAATPTTEAPAAS